MIMRMDSNDLIRAFDDYGRGEQFSREAIEELFNYYEEFDENTEVDIIAICCEWAEYESLEGLHEQYGEEEEEPQETLERIEGETTVLYTTCGYLVAEF